jgi:hypothetical protein
MGSGSDVIYVIYPRIHAVGPLLAPICFWKRRFGAPNVEITARYTVTTRQPRGSICRDSLYLT